MKMHLIPVAAVVFALCTPATAQTNTNDTGLTSIDTSPSPELQRGQSNNNSNQPVNYQSEGVKDPLKPQTSRANLQTTGKRTSGTMSTGTKKDKAATANRSSKGPRPPVVGTPIPKTTPGTRGGSGTSGAGTGLGSVNTTSKSNLAPSDGSANTSR